MSSLNFGVRLPRPLLDRLDECAKIEDRSRNSIIRRALEREFTPAVDDPGLRDAKTATTSTTERSR